MDQLVHSPAKVPEEEDEEEEDDDEEEEGGKHSILFHTLSQNVVECNVFGSVSMY